MTMKQFVQRQNMVQFPKTRIHSLSKVFDSPKAAIYKKQCSYNANKAAPKKYQILYGYIDGEWPDDTSRFGFYCPKDGSFKIKKISNKNREYVDDQKEISRT